jgi:hypothetical protein
MGWSNRPAPLDPDPSWEHGLQEEARALHPHRLFQQGGADAHTKQQQADVKSLNASALEIWDSRNRNATRLASASRGLADKSSGTRFSLPQAWQDFIKAGEQLGDWPALAQPEGDELRLATDSWEETFLSEPLGQVRAAQLRILPTLADLQVCDHMNFALADAESKLRSIVLIVTALLRNIIA